MPNYVNIITGVTGQDGSYLAELLYKEQPNSLIFGLARSVGTNRDLGSLSRADFKVPFYISDGAPQNLIKAYQDGFRFFILNCDFSSEDSVEKAFEQIEVFVRQGQIPNVFGLSKASFSIYPMKFFCYHMGALSHVHESYADPELYFRTNTFGSLYMLRAFMKLFKKLDYHMVRDNMGFFYHAATTELFSGDIATVPQTSKTPFEPQTPYAVSKLAAFYLLQFEMETKKGNYNLFLRQGILANHESPRRPAKFVTKKIVEAVARFLRNGSKTQLGNTWTQRDWGYAKDYMGAVVKMMTPEAPKSLVIGTGVKHTVDQFIDKTLDSYARYLGVRLSKDAIFSIDSPTYMRQMEVGNLCIDANEAKEKIGWTAAYQLDDLIDLMVVNTIQEWGLK